MQPFEYRSVRYWSIEINGTRRLSYFYPCGELSEALSRSMASHKNFSSPLNLAGSCWAFSAALAAHDSALRLAWASESAGAAPPPRGFCEASQLVVAEGLTWGFRRSRAI